MQPKNSTIIYTSKYQNVKHEHHLKFALIMTGLFIISIIVIAYLGTQFYFTKQDLNKSMVSNDRLKNSTIIEQYPIYYDGKIY
jgi:uncharacterized membrane protein YukC